MQANVVKTPKGDIAQIEGLSAPLRTGSDLLDVLMNSPSETVALKAGDLDGSFFELRTGVAGDMLQKVSNYRCRLIILADFSGVESQSMRDFIFESNQHGQVIFAETLESAIAKLR